MNTINEHFEFGEHGGVFGGDEYTQEEWLDIIQEIKEEVKQQDEINKMLEGTCMRMCHELQEETGHMIEDPTKYYRGLVAVKEMREKNIKLEKKVKSLKGIEKEYKKLNDLNEGEIKEMKLKNEMVEVLKKDEKMMKQMKERFIQLKIEEAKMKKNVGNTQEGKSLWDLLPPEVEKKIMYRKKSRDYMIGVGDICMKKQFPRYAKKRDEKTLGFYKIIGETKNDWKVEKITHTTEEVLWERGGSLEIFNKIPRAEEEQELTKHKNVSKKSGGLEIVRDHRNPLGHHSPYDKMLIKAEEDEMFWVY